MPLLLRAALSGALFALAVAVVELGALGGMLTLQHMPPMTELRVAGALAQLALGALLGGLAAPLLTRGWAWQGLGVFAAWAGLSFWLALDRSAVPMWLGGPLTGLVLYALGCWLAARLRPGRRGVPAAVGLLGLGLALLLPGLLAQDRAAGVVVGVPARPGSPDVVFVVLDSVRASRVGAYGYPLATTPTFDTLAAQGVRFADATAPSTWSLPSHASMFTGAFASVHGAHDESRVLRADRPTLAQRLAEAGYETRCYTANPHISAGFGLTRGFASTDEGWREAGLLRDFLLPFRLLNRLGWASADKGGAAVVDHFAAWLATRPAGGPPAFVFLNFLEAHFPFHQVPQPFLGRFTQRPRAELIAAGNAAMAELFGNKVSPEDVAAAAPAVQEMYDAGVAYSDHLLARVVQALEARGTLDNTVLVLVSDHGELLGERGRFGHGPSLAQPDLHVPLALRWPGQLPAGVVIAEPVSTTAVFATVLDLVGLDAPTAQVASLRPLLEGRPGGQPVIAERHVTELGQADGDPLSNPDWRYRVYRSGPLKLVLSTGRGPQLYDLQADPHEERDLSAADAPTLARLQDELRAWEAALGLPALDAAVEAAAPTVDPAAQERLRALGYLE